MRLYFIISAVSIESSSCIHSEGQKVLCVAPYSPMPFLKCPSSCRRRALRSTSSTRVKGEQSDLPIRCIASALHMQEDNIALYTDMRELARKSDFAAHGCCTRTMHTIVVCSVFFFFLNSGIRSPHIHFMCLSLLCAHCDMKALCFARTLLL